MNEGNLKCPTCGQPVNQHDLVYTCTQHGDWVLYSGSLLVRRPSMDELRPERVRMPWEKQLVFGV